MLKENVNIYFPVKQGLYFRESVVFLYALNRDGIKSQDQPVALLCICRVMRHVPRFCESW